MQENRNVGHAFLGPHQKMKRRGWSQRGREMACVTEVTSGRSSADVAPGPAGVGRRQQRAAWCELRLKGALRWIEIAGTPSRNEIFGRVDRVSVNRSRGAF